MKQLPLTGKDMRGLMLSLETSIEEHKEIAEGASEFPKHAQEHRELVADLQRLQYQLVEFFNGSLQWMRVLR